MATPDSADKRQLQEDLQPAGTIAERLKRRNSSPIVFVLKGIEALFIFIFVKLFGCLAYKKEYLRGRWFKGFWSDGYRWAFNGMFAKLFTGHGRGIPWPIAANCRTGINVNFDIDDLDNFQGSAYFQTLGDASITIGKGTCIADGSALITSNHDPQNPQIHLSPSNIVLGEKCWLGTNVVVMPGTVLGSYTTVGANAVVTKSFPEGHCVLAGVPAKKIRDYSSDEAII